ncbi:MAG: glycosyltransferase [Rubrivivax sp.]|nr:MAG: glycosyltransferase [Rubrivivax sp.]
MPQNILYTNTSYHPHVGGGAEVMLRAMAEGMAGRGHQVSVLVSADADGLDRINGIDVHRLKQRNVYWSFPKEARPAWQRMLWHGIDSNNLFMARPIREVMQKVKPDVIVSNNLSGLSVAVWQQAQRLGIPVVHVMHDYYLICPSVTMFKGGRICEHACGSCRAFRRPHAALSNKAVSAVLSVSKSILNTHLAAGIFTNAPIKRVIYNARDLPEPPPRTPLTEQNRPMVFGFIGALTEVKGIQPLIEAFALAAQEAPGITLLVAGAGEAGYEAQLKALAPSNVVKFLGKVDAMAFFQQIDVCIAPSQWNDPLPGVVYEAISQGVPVIGATRGGIPEMVQDGVNGVLFDPLAPGALKAAIVNAARDPQAISQMHTNARASVTRFVDFSAMLREHELLFEEACHV